MLFLWEPLIGYKIMEDNKMKKIYKLDSDDINNIAINIVDKMVLKGLVKDCTNTNDNDEFIVQDLITETIIDMLN